MNSGTTTPSESGRSTPPFSPFEWAYLCLLEDVKTKVVAQTRERWRKDLQKDPAGLSKDEDKDDLKNFKRNLAAALLNLQSLPQNSIRKIPHGTVEQLAAKLQSAADHVPEPTTIGELTDFLENFGHKLFNSFLYQPRDSQGHIALVPFVLRGELAWRPKTVKKLSMDVYGEVLEYCDNRRLPYHIAPELKARFADQLLPCSGGVTPHLFWLVATHWKDVLTHLDRPGFNEWNIIRSIELKGAPEEYSGHKVCTVQRISYWLTRLSMLHKDRDFESGSFSGMVAVLWDQVPPDKPTSSGPIGAFVLTSLHPRAFDDSDKLRLLQVVADHTRRGMLEQQGRAPSNSRVGTTSEDCDFAESSDSETKKSLFDQIAPELHQITNCLATHDGLAYRFSVRSKDVKEASQRALLDCWNLEFRNLCRHIHSLFPTGPWLNPVLVADLAKPNGMPPTILLADLKGTLDFYKSLSEGTRDGPVPKKWLTAAEIPLKLLAPDAAEAALKADTISNFCDAVMGHFKTRFLRNSREDVDYRLLLCHPPNMAPDMVEMETGLAASEKLPDLEDDWLRWKLDGEEPSDGSPAHSVDKFFQVNINCRALLVLESRTVYVPANMDSQPEWLKRYPVYWLLEEIARNYIIGGMLAGRIADASSRSWRYPYFRRYERNTGAYLDVSVPEDQRERFFKAANYLGLAFRNIGKDGWKVNGGDTHDFTSTITKAEQEHLNAYLRPITDDCIAQVLFSEPKAQTIKSIRLQPSPGATLEVTLTLEGIDGKVVAEVLWLPRQTFHLVACCLNHEEARKLVKQDTLWRECTKRELCDLLSYSLLPKAAHVGSNEEGALRAAAESVHTKLIRRLEQRERAKIEHEIQRVAHFLGTEERMHSIIQTIATLHDEAVQLQTRLFPGSVGLLGLFNELAPLFAHAHGVFYRIVERGKPEADPHKKLNIALAAIRKEPKQAEEDLHDLRAEIYAMKTRAWAEGVQNLKPFHDARRDPDFLEYWKVCLSIIAIHATQKRVYLLRDLVRCSAIEHLATDEASIDVDREIALFTVLKNLLWRPYAPDTLQEGAVLTVGQLLGFCYEARSYSKAIRNDHLLTVKYVEPETNETGSEIADFNSLLGIKNTIWQKGWLMPKGRRPLEFLSCLASLLMQELAFKGKDVDTCYAVQSKVTCTTDAVLLAIECEGTLNGSDLKKGPAGLLSGLSACFSGLAELLNVREAVFADIGNLASDVTDTATVEIEKALNRLNTPFAVLRGTFKAPGTTRNSSGLLIVVRLPIQIVVKP